MALFAEESADSVDALDKVDPFIVSENVEAGELLLVAGVFLVGS